MHTRYEFPIFYGSKVMTKIGKSYFKYKGHSQGHMVIDLGVVWKNLFSGVCIPNMKSLSPMVQKLWQTVEKAIFSI